MSVQDGLEAASVKAPKAEDAILNESRARVTHRCTVCNGLGVSLLILRAAHCTAR
jgi:hypothetical protein